ncbi:MAG TPA: 16S rRNA (uracil(1498)-N(3))-methyltransferase [Steroidobacteraceae bacterium]|jgi:16S rRNA (uracil1498-N3)-methyltransferase|nr:16S rRNA (uracil(1498)-N(3))-methyltransferase [Steroidobacteraceae bacterium]
MRLTRVHVREPLTAGQRHTIEGDAANHITRVLRLRPGDPLTLFDGRGGEHEARVGGFRKGAVIVEVGDRSAAAVESPLSLTLAQGVSRGERMDWVVQKATELGVTRIVPVLTERTLVKLDAKQGERKLLHWQGIATAACEQSGRDRIPSVDVPLTLAAFLGGVDTRATRVLLSPAARLRVADLLRPEGDVVALIGPEGGLAEAEQQAALEAGFVAVRLGPRVLRTETAAVAALTLLQHHFGDL